MSAQVVLSCDVKECPERFVSMEPTVHGARAQARTTYGWDVARVQRGIRYGRRLVDLCTEHAEEARRQP